MASAEILTRACKLLDPGDLVFGLTGGQARSKPNAILQTLGLQGRGLSLYSLRRGGATAHFARFGSMKSTPVKGR
eukprot:1259223-Pyramimonas_sp.AAC.1